MLVKPESVTPSDLAAPFLTRLELVGFVAPAPHSPIPPTQRCSLHEVLPSSVFAPSSSALTLCVQLRSACWSAKGAQVGGSGSQHWTVQREEGGLLLGPDGPAGSGLVLGWDVSACLLPPAPFLPGQRHLQAWPRWIGRMPHREEAAQVLSGQEPCRVRVQAEVCLSPSLHVGCSFHHLSIVRAWTHWETCYDP